MRELLGQEELRELLDPAALAEVEASLRPFPSDPERLHDLLRLRGDLRAGEFDEAHAAILEAERRAIRVRIAGEERLAAAEDAGRYRDAIGVVPPSGLPSVFLEPVPDALRSLLARWARGTMLSSSRYSCSVWALPPTGPTPQIVGVPTLAVKPESAQPPANSPSTLGRPASLAAAR